MRTRPEKNRNTKIVCHAVNRMSRNLNFIFTNREQMRMRASHIGKCGLTRLNLLFLSSVSVLIQDLVSICGMDMVKHCITETTSRRITTKFMLYQLLFDV